MRQGHPKCTIRMHAGPIRRLGNPIHSTTTASLRQTAQRVGSGAQQKLLSL